MKILKPYVKLIAPEDFSSPQEFLVYCARMSTKTTDKLKEKDADQFLKNIIYKNQHLSVLEHYWQTFAVTDPSSTFYTREIYYKLLDIFNQADILPNITYDETINIIFISVNPRILHEFDKFYTANYKELTLYDHRAYIIYKIIHYMGPVISNYIINQVVKDPESVDLIAKIFSITPITSEKIREHKDWQRHKFYTFEVLTNRATHLEHVRHRFRCSYTAESTRYVNYSKNGLSFVSPAGNGDLYRLIEKEYTEILDLTKDKTLARAILPNSTAIKYVFTTNHKQLITNFIPLRTAKSAAPDIQFIANEIKKLITGGEQ